MTDDMIQLYVTSVSLPNRDEFDFVDIEAEIEGRFADEFADHNVLNGGDVRAEAVPGGDE